MQIEVTLVLQLNRGKEVRPMEPFQTIREIVVTLAAAITAAVVIHKEVRETREAKAKDKPKDEPPEL